MNFKNPYEKKANLSNERKRLMHEVMAGRLAVVPILHQLSHYVFCDSLLRWLVKNRIVGNNLIEWLKIEHDGSVLGMVQFIVKHHNKNKEIKPIILNKDWIA